MPPEVTVEETTEVKEEVVEEVVKTESEVAKDTYQDKTKTEEVKEETEIEPKKEAPKEEAKEDKGEQEETEGREDNVTLTLSKDSPLDDTALKNVTEFAKENKLTQEAAQAILEREESAESSRAEKQLADHDVLVTDWTKKIEDHPTYGGDKLKEATLIANRPLVKFGSEEMTAFLETSGFSNHPAVFEYHHKLGLAMGDDGFIKGEKVLEKTPEKPAAHKMYPKQAPNYVKEE